MSNLDTQITGILKNWHNISTNTKSSDTPGTLVNDLKSILTQMLNRYNMTKLVNADEIAYAHSVDRNNPHEFELSQLDIQVIDKFYEIWTDSGYHGTKQDMIDALFRYVLIATIEDLEQGTSEEHVTPVDVVTEYIHRHNTNLKDVHYAILNPFFITDLWRKTPSIVVSEETGYPRNNQLTTSMTLQNNVMSYPPNTRPAELLSNTVIQTPAYIVGSNTLTVEWNGIVVTKDIHYEESGTLNTVSTAIKTLRNLQIADTLKIISFGYDLTASPAQFLIFDDLVSRWRDTSVLSLQVENMQPKATTLLICDDDNVPVLQVLIDDTRTVKLIGKGVVVGSYDPWEDIINNGSPMLFRGTAAEGLLAEDVTLFSRKIPDNVSSFRLSIGMGNTLVTQLDMGVQGVVVAVTSNHIVKIKNAYLNVGTALDRTKTTSPYVSECCYYNDFRGSQLMLPLDPYITK